MPKQEFTAHSVTGSFPVPPLTAFSKKNIYQAGGREGKGRKMIATCYRQIGKNEKYVNDSGNALMFKRMLLISCK